MPNRTLLSLAVIAVALALPLAGANAAPQVLGLVASNGVPTPLTCDGGDCSAHFSTFCLQQAREAPSHGHPYTVAGAGEITLVVSTRDGRTLRLPAGDRLRIASLIGFTSVKMSLPEAVLSGLDATAAAIEVGPAVSLLPLAMAGDTNPQDEHEVALATGPVRAAASRSFEAPGVASDAARISSVLINALPESGRQEEAARSGLWEHHVGGAIVAAATPEGLQAARKIYEGCQISVDSRSMFSLRNCLELRHADLMAATNQRFWKESGGS